MGQASEEVNWLEHADPGWRPQLGGQGSLAKWLEQAAPCRGAPGKVGRVSKVGAVAGASRSLRAKGSVAKERLVG